MEPKDELKNWLEDETLRPLTRAVNGSNKVYIKIPKRENFFYLFFQRFNKSLEAESGHGFAYAALYNKQDGLVYNAGLDFRETFPEAATGPTVFQLSKTVNESICTRLEDLVAKNLTDLLAQRLSERNLSQLEDYKKYQLEADIRTHFFQGLTSSEVEYQIGYDPTWTAEELLDYLEDADGYIDRKVETLRSASQEYFLLELQKTNLIKSGLEKLEKEADSPLHRQRKILYALRNSPAKTVKVTIHKNGIEFTFRTTATEVSRGTYSKFSMPIKELYQFETLFGSSASYAAADIVNITYMGKSLYRAEAYEPQEAKAEESESPTLTL